MGQKKNDEAVTRLTTVLEKKDSVAYAYFWRAQAYDKQDKAARMVADYEAAYLKALGDSGVDRERVRVQSDARGL